MDNCSSVTRNLLKLLKVKYTKTFLEDSILSHPEHPSLLCISDTLEKYNIDVLPIRINYEKLTELPFPLIVQMSNQGNMFYVLESCSNDNTLYFDDKGKTLTLSTKDFLKKWTRVCLLAEANELSQEPGIKDKSSERRTIVTLAWLIGFLSISWGIFNIFNHVPENNLTYSLLWIYTILKFIGLTMGIMLLLYEVDKYNPMLKNFCAGGEKVDCDSVLNSRYSKVLNGRFSLGIVGFAYFFGTLFFLLICNFSSASMAVVAYMSFSTFPFVVLSTYYQGIVIKQWCKFCVIIQGVLLMEFLVSFFGGLYKNTIDWGLTLPLLVLMLTPMLIWKFLKPLLEMKKEVSLHKRGLKKIKNNPYVLRGLPSKTREIHNSTKGLGIIFNNDAAKFSIIKVCNPYCDPCAKAHDVLEELVEKGKINLQILFTASAEGNDLKAKPVSHFLALDDKEDKKNVKEALNDWYKAEKKDYDVFCEKYPLNGELKKQKNKIQDMYDWSEAEGISYTPTIFIDGHELPKEYSLEDLIEVLD